MFFERKRTNGGFFSSLEVTEKPIDKWKVLVKKRLLTLSRVPLFDSKAKIFTIGSCFAEEIRKALTQSSMTCLPMYRNISFDPKSAKVDTLPEREHMNYYNSFSILQELERAEKSWRQEPDDLWELPNVTIKDSKIVRQKGSVAYQDPYRRLVFANTREALWDIIEQINTVMSEGIRSADVVFITLGMTETFFQKKTGKAVNQFPLYGGGVGKEETFFRNSSFEDNLENLRRSIAILQRLNPRAKTVITVSPVPLNRTFTAQDIFVANMHSKSTLRAAVGEVVSETDQATYFPAYEVVMAAGISGFKDDMLHVQPKLAEQIVRAFIEAHLDTSPSTSQ